MYSLGCMNYMTVVKDNLIGITQANICEQYPKYETGYHILPSSVILLHVDQAGLYKQCCMCILSLRIKQTEEPVPLLYVLKSSAEDR